MRAAIAAVALLLVAAGGLAAQQPVARVDYIAGTTLYLRIAQARRWREGDTVRVARAGAADWLGRGRVLGVAESRLSLDWLEGTPPPAVGDSVRLELPAVRPADVAADSLPLAPGPGLVAATRPVARSRAPTGPRLYGRVGLELDAMRSSTGAPGTDRSTTIPTLRMRSTADGLPGGLRLALNLRAAYRADTALFDQQTVVNVHEASIERTAGLLQLRLGRFTNVHEPYSGYVDGALLRIGGSGAGAGALYGFDPRRGSEGFSSERRTLTIFADLHRGGPGHRYDADVSVHRISGDSATRSAAGLTQYLSLGRVRFHQMLRVDEGVDGWQVALLQLSGSVPVTGRASVRLRYSLDDPAAELGLLPEQSWRWQRAGAAFSWLAGPASFGVDAGAAWTTAGDSVDRGDDVAGTLAGWLDVPRLVAGFGADLNASVWQRADDRTIQIAPALQRRLGAARLRAGYRHFRSERSSETFTLQGVEAGVLFPLRGVDGTLRFDHQWGTEYSMTRLLSGVWLRL